MKNRGINAIRMEINNNHSKKGEIMINLKNSVNRGRIKPITPNIYIYKQ